jgi:hypothetical protein
MTSAQPFEGGRQGTLSNIICFKGQSYETSVLLTNMKRNFTVKIIWTSDQNETWACICSTRRLPFGSHFEMPVHITSWKCIAVILEQNLSMLCFICEKASSHVYVLPDTLVKFHANLGNSENQERSIWWRSIKGNLRFLVEITMQYWDILQLSPSCSLPGAWLQKSF